MSKKTFSLNPFERVPAPQGARALQDSAAYCTRCNACVQSCPSYLLRREEAFSPRGRTQLLRLLLERKLKPAEHAALIENVTRSCLLCARCTTACAGQIPVAEHMVCLRRAAQTPLLPGPLKALLCLRAARPVLFDRAVRLFKFMRRAGLVRLMRLSGLLQLPALGWIKHADDILPRRGGTLQKTLQKTGVDFTPAKPDWVYLPSLEAAYLDEETGRRTLQLLTGKKTYVLFGFSSGLFEHMYGGETLRLQAARRLLARWEKLAAKRKLPLITDSIETYLFLKNYPVLFCARPGWKRRAEAFAAQVRFVTDLPFPPPKTPQAGKTALDVSCACAPAGQCAVRARKILKTHFGKNFVECEYSRFPTPAGGAAFICGAPAQETTLENVKDVARRQIRQVYCLSGLAALELNAALRRHYPAAQARHIVYLQAKP